MALTGTRWTTNDRYGNEIYLTNERWQHIIDSINHPEMKYYEEHLRTSIRSGRRTQDTLNPQKYRYNQIFDDLYLENTHIIAIVLFGFKEDLEGKPTANNYIVTAYQKQIG
ncbi:hypothetical protein JT359_01760 [Candidatus Poribacteria bacterium]|nr:hypothetical protein [Candidatus Poribacteria bacterium]